jgi:hypothetical protein
LKPQWKNFIRQPTTHPRVSLKNNVDIVNETMYKKYACGPPCNFKLE